MLHGYLASYLIVAVEQNSKQKWIERSGLRSQLDGAMMVIGGSRRPLLLY